MARTLRNGKLDTRTARAKLAERREPYWTVLVQGGALGYRRGRKAGTWIARWRDKAGKQHYRSLGAADDALDADGIAALSFAQAQERARAGSPPSPRMRPCPTLRRTRSTMPSTSTSDGWHGIAGRPRTPPGRPTP